VPGRPVGPAPQEARPDPRDRRGRPATVGSRFLLGLHRLGRARSSPRGSPRPALAPAAGTALPGGADRRRGTTASYSQARLRGAAALVTTDDDALRRSLRRASSRTALGHSAAASAFGFASTP